MGTTWRSKLFLLGKGGDCCVVDCFGVFEESINAAAIRSPNGFLAVGKESVGWCGHRERNVELRLLVFRREISSVLSDRVIAQDMSVL